MHEEMITKFPVMCNMLIKIFKISVLKCVFEIKQGFACWQRLVIPDTWEAEAKGM